MPNDISEIEFKQRLIKLFKEFIDVCNKNKLRYYAAYGTALGAVRHRGLSHGTMILTCGCHVKTMSDFYRLEIN